MFRNYDELEVWQRLVDLVTKCYEVSRQFPDDERFGLTIQLRRAAVSVPANIAEGHGRGTSRAFINHLWIANGSLKELETHVVIAHRLGYIDDSSHQEIIQLSTEVGKMLTGFRRSVEQRL